MSDPRRTALVADDDEFFRMAARVVLTGRLGFADVTECDSFDSAMEQLGEPERRVGLALMDLAMPGMESAANLAAVRECFPDIRVAVVSASERREDILLALASGVHGYVPKRLGIGEMTQALEAILNGQIYVPSSLAQLPAASASAVPPATEEAPAPLPLTPRQRDVLELIVRGQSNKEIARSLGLGEGTVKIHLAALFRNLGVANRASAAVVGARLLQGNER